MSYTIRQVATQFHMQPSTLRYYEDQGLLTNVERTETGQRIYEDCHIDRLRAICCFKNAGMTIDDLKKLAFRCLVWVSGAGGGGAGRVVWGYGYHVVVHRRPATA